MKTPKRALLRLRPQRAQTHWILKHLNLGEIEAKYGNTSKPWLSTGLALV